MVKMRWRPPHGPLDLEALAPENGDVVRSARTARAAGRASKLLRLRQAAASAALGLALAACATAPEPRIVTKEVLTPVAVNCTSNIPGASGYPDTDAALKGAANIAERVRLLMAGRAVRSAEIVELRASVAGCR